MRGIKIHPALLIAGGLLILFLAIDNHDKKKQIAALLREIAKQQALGLKVRAMLSELVDENKTVNPDLANEVTQIIALLNIKQDATALMKLAKVIENLLIELYGKDKEFKQKMRDAGRKKAVFADYLEHAKEKGVVAKDDYLLVTLLKDIRNEEAHKLNVIKEATRAAAAMIAGIGVIFSLCKLLKRTTVEAGVI
jgi:hypothetical protein